MKRALFLLCACASHAQVTLPAQRSDGTASSEENVIAADADAGAPLASQGVTTWGDPGKPAPADTTPAPPLPPGFHLDTVSVSGSLVPEVIARIIHLNRARFRFCYSNGLRRDPAMSGRVAIHFVIARPGNVSSATVDRSATTLSDADVQACLVDAFKQLSFPQPEGGEVGVTYPMVFTPQR